MKMRNPNCVCKICNKEIYRKPSELLKLKNVYCSKECLWNDRGRIESKSCKTCKKQFRPYKRNSDFCSKSCANSARRGKTYSKLSAGNKSQTNLALLKNTFNFEICMVSGCRYSKTFDVHRLVEGKDGGKYEIGNMFAICPNHHAESHRGLIKLEKINDYTLRAINIEANRSGLETNLES